MGDGVEEVVGREEDGWEEGEGWEEKEEGAWRGDAEDVCCFLGGLSAVCFPLATAPLFTAFLSFSGDGEVCPLCLFKRDSAFYGHNEEGKRDERKT